MMLQRGKRVQGKRPAAQKKPQGNVEKKVNRLLVQFIASAMLFLLVFVGGGLIPERMFDVFGEVNRAISGESELLESVQTLGDTVSEGESWADALKDWCVDTFLPAQVEDSTVQPLSERLEASECFRNYLLPELSARPTSPVTQPIE